MMLRLSTLTVSHSLCFPLLRLLTFGCAVEVTGTLKQSPHQKQLVELEADQILVIGQCNPVVRKIVSENIPDT